MANALLSEHVAYAVSFGCQYQIQAIWFTLVWLDKTPFADTTWLIEHHLLLFQCICMTS
jgi:hypothetical protein